MAFIVSGDLLRLYIEPGTLHNLLKALYCFLMERRLILFQTDDIICFSFGYYFCYFPLAAHRIRWRRDKGRLDHVAYEQVANPLGILPVSLVALLRLCVLGVSEGDEAGFFEDAEDRNPELTGRFHADFLAIVLVKPDRQLQSPLEKDEKRA